MYTLLSILGIIVGAAMSLIAYDVIQLEKYISPDEAQEWHRKYAKLFKIAGPAVVVIGIIFLIKK